MNYLIIIKQIYLIIALVILSYYGGVASATANESQPTDAIELAALMLRDGHNDRALMALQNVNLEDSETDLARFYTLQGLAYMNLNDSVAAKSNLQLALKNGQQDKVIFVYLAQIYYSLKEYQNTIQAISKSGDHLHKNPTLIILKAQAYWQLENTDAAINALNVGKNIFPNDFRFLRRKVFYFVQLGLYQEATRLGKQYLTLSKATAEDYIAIGNALRLSKEYQQALNILEIARLQFANNETLAKLLAHTYLDQGKLNSAAFILEQAALINSDLISEAAEVYRRAGRFHKALLLNERVQDQKVKFKQRLSILLSLQQYEQAANMEASLYRNGLLEDQNIRYALAYALFSSGRFSAVNKHLDHLKDAELFRRGIELRRLMEACETEPWKCV